VLPAALVIVTLTPLTGVPSAFLTVTYKVATT